MSSSAVAFSSGTGVWDFTTSPGSAHTNGGLAMKQLFDGKYGMFGGDSSADGQYTVLDYNEWLKETKEAQTGLPAPGLRSRRSGSGNRLQCVVSEHKGRGIESGPRLGATSPSSLVSYVLSPDSSLLSAFRFLERHILAPSSQRSLQASNRDR